VGDIRPELPDQQGEGYRGLARSISDVATGSSNNESQNVTNEMGVLHSFSDSSGDAIAKSEARSGRGTDTTGLYRTTGELVLLKGTSLSLANGSFWYGPFRSTNSTKEYPRNPNKYIIR
jgi:hypothetical protein